jgi:ribonuclease G
VSAEILINVTPRESRAALLDAAVLQELHIERANRLGLAGNIYKGRASRVLPGMQAAFIDIGLERTAFLHVSDIAAGPPDGNELGLAPSPDVRAHLTEGDELLVQVVKDPLGSKGARLTTFVSLPSRYLVYMPKGQGAGVSARIEDEAERTRLRALLDSMREPGQSGGYIARTVAEGASGDALRADMLFLQRLWEVVQARGFTAPAGTLVHEDLPLHLRILRDLLSTGIERVQVDDEVSFGQMVEFSRTFMPESVAKLELYRGGRPILDLYGIEDEITRALERKVALKSGGHLIIDQTESMTTIDVNTGAFVGHRNLEDTIFRTNLEAAVAIARQLRLRNLGGIIIIDFIDMQNEDHRAQVLQALAKPLAQDHARTNISAVSPLGLVEMTRKRTRESLEHLLCRPCPTCDGRRYVKSAETVAYEIFRDVLRQAREFEVRGLIVLAHQDVIELLLDEESSAFAELELVVGKPIRLQTEALYAVDQYDVVLV